jgi:cell division protein FtsA
MLDGQIHDVAAVANSITRIKTALETELGISLSSAAVAAAGRALETREGEAERGWPVIREITRDDVVALEFQAVQAAQRDLQAENTQYLCAGYSVTQYVLEDQEIGNLVGQFGRRMQTKVIATFLPRVVVDSLFSALKKSGLNLHSMTLEPIAALSIAIPDNMRILNLALVDIGAGTSDIALVRDGNIFAYAMVAQGGDKITETVGKALLLDFNSAEDLKCRISQSAAEPFFDILGNESLLTRKEFLAIIQPVCAAMVQQIADHILELNQRAPDAVILIGGGSMTPALAEMLAEALDLPVGRVGIKNQIESTFLECPADYLAGPQGITPVGIAYESFRQNNLPIMRLLVNQRDIMLWNTDQADVARALLDAGVQFSQLYGRPGMGKTIEFDGEVRIFQGTMGTPPVILVNGEPATLSSWVRDGDVIDFTPGEDGVDAEIVLAELVQDAAVGVATVNGVAVPLQAQLAIDGVICLEGTMIPDGARVELVGRQTLEDCLRAQGLEEAHISPHRATYFIDGVAVEVTWPAASWTLNGEPAELHNFVRDGDRIEYVLPEQLPTVGELLPAEETASETGDAGFIIWINQEPVNLRVQDRQLLQNGQPVGPETILNDGDSIMVRQWSPAEMILSDVFTVYSLEGQPGKRLKITLDGENAGFTTPLYAGCKIEFTWE